MKWRDGGNLGVCDRVIIDNTDEVCTVAVRKYVSFNEGNIYKYTPEPWSKGEENFRLILQAPQLLEALEAIADLADHLSHITDQVTSEDLETLSDYAANAIAVVKGE